MQKNRIRIMNTLNRLAGANGEQGGGDWIKTVKRLNKEHTHAYRMGRDNNLAKAKERVCVWVGGRGGQRGVGRGTPAITSPLKKMFN